jgi:hypothetical protein
MEDNGLLEDMEFGAQLDDFYSGNNASGMVNLQPQPSSFGSSLDDDKSTHAPGESPGGAAGAAATGAAGMAAMAASAAAAAASAIVGGRTGEVVGAAVGAAVPTSLQPAKEKAGLFLSKARPWKDFLIPLSIPKGNEACSRITANLYCFQTNYAILFVLWLVMNIMFQPSALISLAAVVLIWMAFLKKNDDPDWKPVVGGMELGPMQRWLALAMITAIVLLVMAGPTIFNSALMYLLFATIHGIVHDASSQGLPGNDNPVPL